MRAFKFYSSLSLLVLFPTLATAEGISAETLSGSQDTESSVSLDSESAGVPASSAKIRIGGFLGGNYLSSENELGNAYHPDQVAGSGFLIGLQGSYRLVELARDSAAHPVVHAELEAKLLFSSTDSSTTRASESAQVLGWRANALVDLFGKGALTPFALVGVGGETIFGSDRFMTTPDTDFAWYVGGGARYAVAPQIDIRGDLRFGGTASRRDDFSSLAELHVGVGYQFGTGSSKASAPAPVVEKKEPVVGDEDGDGVSDADDMCPKLPEVFNQIDDEDGCPEEDTDGDGLLGSRDQCPAAAEDLDGFADDDGCPETDNDEDGIDDGADKCPSEPETVNGYQNRDGCPDEVPEAVKQFVGTIEGIVFKTGSAKIKKSSEAVLMRAFRVLVDNPDLRIEISGHTDDRGGAERNQILSKKRADYVKYFLVDKGISADRIETLGKGGEAPVADNGTNDGRQKNRRIEFRLLQ